MHYALLFYQSPEEFAAREAPEKHAVFLGAFVPYMKALQEAGIVVTGAGLEPPTTATSVMPAPSGHRVQDGPFADTKEQLGGFFIIDVPDMDTALKWAARFPAGPHGGVEVRPVLPPNTHAEMLKSVETATYT